jgi:Chalcone isomerase-like
MGVTLRSARFALLVLVASLAAAPSPARTLAGVSMPDSVRVDGTLLHLNGMALYRKYGFKVLVAGLYLPKAEHDAAKILAADTPRRYVSRFLRNVGAKRVRNAWQKGLARNTPNATGAVKAQFDELCGWARDFREGEEIDVTYVPDAGSTVLIAGERKGILPGKGFSDAYLRLALGQEPSLGAAFKRRLLGAESVRASSVPR